MASSSEEENTLDYSIHSYSSFSRDFPPEEILTDTPSNPKSRWLSSDNRSPQFVVLKLSRPSIVTSITFGKYDKSHPCNLRKFCIYGGMSADHLHLLLEDGLKNDPVPETFNIRFHQKQDVFPCQFIKIVPLQSWGYSFNFSIWYIRLWGTTNKRKVAAAVENFRTHCDKEAVRICLKHLRENDYSEAFEALQKKAKVSLEHPLLTQLHNMLVVKGDFVAVERLIEQAVADGYIEEYISSQPVTAQWTQLQFTMQSDEASGLVDGGPTGRGGHQMCIDQASQTLYLHGGWDGTNDLSDFWSYDIGNGVWSCICEDTSLVGGPSARSCHKMCLDPEEGVFYLLGQYLEQSSRELVDLYSDLEADFYSYSLKDSSWTLLSRDTYRDCGPKLIFDHQMCFDEQSKTLYVFGGKILSDLISGRGSNVRYSGLYAYYVTEKQWVCIQPDLITQPYNYSLMPRMAHSMLLDSENHHLYIMGGQREEQLSDMIMYNLQSDIITVLADGEATQIPAAGYTVKTAFITNKSEICLFASLSQSEESENKPVSKNSSNMLWTYNLKSCSWKSISQANQSTATSPVPRYAHQFLYNPTKDVYYMFGGNQRSPSKSLSLNMRLDDFWELKLVSVSKEELVRHCFYSIRNLRFTELAATSPVEAISYLQVQLASLVDHSNSQESAEFRELATALFNPLPNEAKTGDSEQQQHFSRQRHSLYNKLSSYFPCHMTQPSQNITDLVRL